jgi:hypothetical protein
VRISAKTWEEIESRMLVVPENSTIWDSRSVLDALPPKKPGFFPNLLVATRLFVKTRFLEAHV